MQKSPASLLTLNSQRKLRTLQPKIRHKNQQALSTSVLSARSASTPFKSNKSNGIKLPNSFYNDRQNIYMNRSRTLSEKSIQYQVKQISFSQRKKYTEERLEKVVNQRSQSEKSTRAHLATMSLPKMNRQFVRQKMTSLNNKKLSKLINGANSNKFMQSQKSYLMKEIKQKREANSKTERWQSPFTSTNTFKSKFEGKNIVSKKFEGTQCNTNRTELKVLNLDRLFRNKDGKLGNIVPIPIVKISAVSSRSNLAKAIKKKDTIHQVIDQYNRLLRICKLQKTKPRIGVRGHNFTKSPTLEELMGIKVHQYQKGKHISAEDEEVTEEIFKEHNQFYKMHIKQDVHLTRRLFSGLQQQQAFNLAALTRYYAIFINRVASMGEKIKFLLYFFVPFGQQKIELGILKLILELLCEQLPQIGNLASGSDFLTKQEKSKIFLEALNRVLFADIKEYMSEGEVMINRAILEVIFQRNQDAVDLLIKLLIRQ